MEMPGLIDSSFPYMLSIKHFHWGSPAKKWMPYKIEATQGGNGMKRDRQNNCLRNTERHAEKSDILSKGKSNQNSA